MTCQREPVFRRKSRMPSKKIASRLLALAFCLMFLSLAACAGQNIEVRPRGEAVVGVGVGNHR